MRTEKFKYCYFVSYIGINETGRMSFGDTTFDCTNKMNTKSELQEARKNIMDGQGFKSCSILNIIKLRG